MSFIAVVSLIRLYTLKDSFFIKYDSDDDSFKKNYVLLLNNVSRKDILYKKMLSFINYINFIMIFNFIHTTILLNLDL